MNLIGEIYRLISEFMVKYKIKIFFFFQINQVIHLSNNWFSIDNNDLFWRDPINIVSKIIILNRKKSFIRLKYFFLEICVRKYPSMFQYLNELIMIIDNYIITNKFGDIIKKIFKIFFTNRNSKIMKALRREILVPSHWGKLVKLKEIFINDTNICSDNFSNYGYIHFLYLNEQIFSCKLEKFFNKLGVRLLSNFLIRKIEIFKVQNSYFLQKIVQRFIYCIQDNFITKNYERYKFLKIKNLEDYLNILNVQLAEGLYLLFGLCKTDTIKKKILCNLTKNVLTIKVESINKRYHFLKELIKIFFNGSSNEEHASFLNILSILHDSNEKLFEHKKEIFFKTEIPGLFDIKYSNIHKVFSNTIL